MMDVPRTCVDRGSKVLSPRPRSRMTSVDAGPGVLRHRGHEVQVAIAVEVRGHGGVDGGEQCRCARLAAR
jgi:hypothetical protein